MFDINKTKKLAELSKLHFTDSELEDMTKDMSDIIELMDKVREFKTDTLPYTLSPIDCDDIRRDIPKKSYPKSDITSNVKQNSFIVPKIV